MIKDIPPSGERTRRAEERGGERTRPGEKGRLLRAVKSYSALGGFAVGASTYGHLTLSPNLHI